MNDSKQLNIKGAEAYELATEIAEIRGESRTSAVLQALRREAEYARKQRDRDVRIAALMDLGRRYSALANRDPRTPDEIIGYDENGLPTLIVADTSAVVAILRQEDDALTYAACLVDADIVLMSAASLLELTMVVGSTTSRSRAIGEEEVDEFLAAEAIVVEPVTVEQAMLARVAFRRFGKGTGHGARLNFGDCFSYSLARLFDVPLLYKGDDFARTDIRSALG